MRSLDVSGQKNDKKGASCRVNAGKRKTQHNRKALLLPVGHAPRRLLGRARGLEPLVLLAARPRLGVVRGEPRVFGRDLGIDAGERGP